MEKNLTIGKLAKAAEVGVETVRYYQRHGLLDTPSDAGGFRRYGNDHVERLRFIRRSQSVGFTLKEIAELLSLNDSRDHLEARRLAHIKLLDIEQRVLRLKKMKKALEELVHHCECGGEAMPCPIIRMSL